MYARTCTCAHKSHHWDSCQGTGLYLRVHAGPWLHNWFSLAYLDRTCIYLRLPQLFSSMQERTCSFPPTFNLRPILLLLYPPPPVGCTLRTYTKSPSLSGNEASSNYLKYNCNYCGRRRKMFIPKLEFSHYSLLCGCVHVYSTTRPA